MADALKSPRQEVERLRSQLGRAQGRRDEVARRLQGIKAEIRYLEDEEEILDLVASLFRTLIDREVTANVQAV